MRGLYKRTDSPCWWMCFTDENGKLVRKSTDTTNKTLAKTIRDKQRTLVAEGRYLDIKKVPTTPFFTLLEEWWTKRGQTMKTRGLAGMLQIWRNAFGNVSVKEITQRTV